MAKFYGTIGYSETIETSPGVWNENITEKKYSGDVIRDSKNWQTGENINDDLIINNQISVISDLFSYKNFQSMRYVKWMGVSWKIIKVDIQRPRLILTIGGIYNGESNTTSDTP